MFDVPPIPEPSSENRSGIAITVDQNIRTGLLNEGKSQIKKIFFIKLEDKNDSLKKNKTIASNYYYVPFMAGFQADAVDNFLLDIEPGYYAAVGAMVGMYYVYFPEEVIKASIIDVKPNRIVYMGEFKLQKISYNKNNNSPDRLQHYYYSNVLLGSHRYEVHGKVAMPWGYSSLFQAPKINKIIKSNEEEIDFLEGYLGFFKNSGWSESIQNRLSDLKLRNGGRL